MISDTLRQSLLACPTLPSLPPAVLRVIELAREPDVRLQALIEALSYDPALVVRLLSLANTPFYIRTTPAESLREAVERLGLDTTVSLAMGFSLARSYDNRSRGNGLDLCWYWQRSLTSAVAAQELARHLPSGADTESVFTAALLQDIGMLALDAAEGTLYADEISACRQHGEIIQQERLKLSVDHAEVGAWLASSWGLSPRSCDWIRRSHDYPAGQDVLTGCECVMLSGRLADVWLSDDSHAALALLDPWLGKGPYCSELLGSIQERLPTISQLFDICSPGKIDPQRLLIEGKQLLVERSLKLQRCLLQKDEELEHLRAHNAQLDQAARFDPLTHLYNRNYLTQLLDKCFSRAKRDALLLAVVFIDLDHFKQINDEYGHPVGDEVLKEFARLLRGLTGTDIIFGRYGGEEFLAILPGASRKKASTFALDVCTKLRSRPLVHCSNKSIFVTASVGIASLSEGHFSTPEEMIKVADQRMYFSKKQGRDRVTTENH